MLDGVATGENLLQVYDILYNTYGPQHWWPAEDSFEVIVGAVLTQSAAWTNVEKAITNLKEADVLSPQSLLSTPAEQLAKLVFPAGYYNVKARKLKAFVERLFSGFEGNLDRLFALNEEALRAELLSVFGIGPETADSIILYAAAKPIFVVDAYTKRLFSRLGVLASDARYESIQALFERDLPRDAVLFNEYHALIVAHCKASCKKIPVCKGCCLEERCGFRGAATWGENPVDA